MTKQQDQNLRYCTIIITISFFVGVKSNHEVLHHPMFRFIQQFMRKKLITNYSPRLLVKSSQIGFFNFNQYHVYNSNKCSDNLNLNKYKY